MIVVIISFYLLLSVATVSATAAVAAVATLDDVPTVQAATLIIHASLVPCIQAVPRQLFTLIKYAYQSSTS